MRKVLFGLACWATIGLASSRADVTYRYVADQSSYTGAVGSTVPVQLLLEEKVTGTSTSLIFNDKGLFGAGVILTSPDGAIFGSTPTTNDFRISGNVLGTPNGFSGPPPTLTPPTANDNGPPGGSPASATKAGLIINADVGTGPQFTSGTAATRTILLGTVNVKVGATPTTLTVTPYGVPFSTITQNSTDLDFGTQAVNGYTGTTNNPLGNFAFTVGAAIPEPSSIALCGLMACGMGYVGYRRRKVAV